MQRKLWKVGQDFLVIAKVAATVLAIRDMERAGVDIISDGEIRRESYSNHMATALDGIDIDNPGTAIDRTGHPNPKNNWTNTEKRPIETEDVKFLRANTDRQIKITLQGLYDDTTNPK